MRMKDYYPKISFLNPTIKQFLRIYFTGKRYDGERIDLRDENFDFLNLNEIRPNLDLKEEERKSKYESYFKKNLSSESPGVIMCDDDQIEMLEFINTSKLWFLICNISTNVSEITLDNRNISVFFLLKEKDINSSVVKINLLEKKETHVFFKSNDFEMSEKKIKKDKDKKAKKEKKDDNEDSDDEKRDKKKKGKIEAIKKFPSEPDKNIEFYKIISNQYTLNENYNGELKKFTSVKIPSNNNLTIDNLTNNDHVIFIHGEYSFENQKINSKNGDKNSAGNLIIIFVDMIKIQINNNIINNLSKNIKYCCVDYPDEAPEYHKKFFIDGLSPYKIASDENRKDYDITNEGTKDFENFFKYFYDYTPRKNNNIPIIDAIENEYIRKNKLSLSENQEEAIYDFAKRTILSKKLDMELVYRYEISNLGKEKISAGTYIPETFNKNIIDQIKKSQNDYGDKILDFSDLKLYEYSIYSNNEIMIKNCDFLKLNITQENSICKVCDCGYLFIESNSNTSTVYISGKIHTLVCMGKVTLIFDDVSKIEKNIIGNIYDNFSSYKNYISYEEMTESLEKYKKIPLPEKYYIENDFSKNPYKRTIIKNFFYKREEDPDWSTTMIEKKIKIDNDVSDSEDENFYDD